MSNPLSGAKKMSVTTVNITFDGENKGTLNASSQTALGAVGFAPYELILGGLGACLNHTFQSVVDKQRLSIAGITYQITGTKREEIPTTLKEVVINAVVTGAAPGSEEKIQKAFDKACEYCSMYSTLSNVAEMKPHLTFK
jgi:putative redox protein